MGACLELDAQDAALPIGAECGQLQRSDKRLREGPAVGAGFERALGDAALRGGAGRANTD